MAGGIEASGYNSYFSALFQRSLQSNYFQSPARRSVAERTGAAVRRGRLRLHRRDAVHFQQTTIGYAAMPDFANANVFPVDKAKGVVTTRAASTSRSPT